MATQKGQEVVKLKGLLRVTAEKTLPIAVLIILKLGTINLITSSPHSIFSLIANKPHAIANLLTNTPCICQPCHAPLSSLS